MGANNVAIDISISTTNGQIAPAGGSGQLAFSTVDGTCDIEEIHIAFKCGSARVEDAAGNACSQRSIETVKLTS